jgi:hypothetical protein
MIPSRASAPPGHDYTTDGDEAPSLSIDKTTRYQIDDDTATIMEAKCIILKIFKTVRGIREHIRVRKFLSVYLSENGNYSNAVNPIKEIIEDDTFSLAQLGGNIDYVDTIFIDLLMYEDEDFFEQAFKCLLEEHEPTKSLFHDVHHIHLITAPIAAPMNSYENLYGEIWLLRELLETAEVWGHIDTQHLTTEEQASH